jgi:hypothetical protein
MKARLAIRMAAILLVAMSAGVLRLQAQTAVNWTGSGNGNWNTGSDWSGGVVPNNGGGKTYNVTINPGPSETVTLNLNTTISDLTLGTAATLQSAAGDSLTIASGGSLSNSGTLFFNTSGSNITVGSGGTLTNNGTLDLEASRETLNVTGTTTNGSGADLTIEGGSAATFTGNVNNSGTFATGFSGGNNTVTVTGTFTNAAGSAMDLYGSGDVVSVNALSNSGTLDVYTGATLNITGGGQGITDIVAGSSVTLAGTLNVVNSGVSTSGLGQLTTVNGELFLNNNQTTAVTPAGGTLSIGSAGSVMLSDGAATTTTLSITGSVNNSGSFNTGFSGGTNTVNVSGTFTNNTGGLLTLYAGAGIGAVGTDVVNIATLSNAGTVSLQDPGATLDITGTGTLTNSGNIDLTEGALKFNSSSASLTGGGTITLGNSNSTETGVIQVGTGDTGTLTNVNNTITGYGNLGNGTLKLVNKGTINSNGNVSSAGGLTIQPGSSGMANSGTMEATNQGTLVLQGTFNNAGGTIEALGENGGTTNATVQLIAGTVINGGTLTTTTVGTNSGLIEDTTGTVTLNGVTNSGTYADNMGTTTTLKGIITNSGSITLSGSTLSMGNSVTLNGGGTVILSNNASNLITGATSGLTLTTANTIEGAGTISNLGIVNTGTIAANQSTPLIILPSSAGLNNQGTLSVSAGDTMEIGTSSGGALLNFSGNTLTGGTYAVSGTLEFGASGTSVVTDAANISLIGSAAKIVNFAGQNVLKNLATITSAGSFAISGGANFKTAGNFTNDGNLTVDTGSAFQVTGTLSNFSSSTNTLTGGTFTVGGKMDFAGANIVTDAANITLDGTGEIVNSTSGGNGLANLATITSAGSFTLDNDAAFTTAGNLTDKGKLTVTSGSTLTVTGHLTNFNSSTDTLASGTYTVGGTLEFTGANIVNNAANLTITGTSGKILNGTTNGLANFANNTGVFTVTGNGNFSTGSANFTNSGAVSVITGSIMTVGGGDAYNQSSGTTTVDGMLTASAGINVTGETILGAGQMSGNVTVGGSGTTPTISAGNTGKAGLLAITGNYTQLSTATMNSFIGGTTVGTQYSQLQVSGTASLAGTLTVTLASGFTPTVGSTFTVLTAGSVVGTFADSTIAINSTEHFNVSYTSTGVVLTVASGAASQSRGVPRPIGVAAAPTKQEPVLTSGLRHRIGGVPQGGNRFLVVGVGNRGRSGVILADRYGLSGYESSNHLPARVAAPWEHMPSLAAPVAQLPGSLDRASVPQPNNWNGSARGVSSPRMPVNPLMRRTPARNLPSMLPRLAR